VGLVTIVTVSDSRFFFFVASYDSQGYGGGIRPPTMLKTLVLIWTYSFSTGLLLSLLGGWNRNLLLEEFCFSYPW
jgi:hypothetical protein